MLRRYDGYVVALAWGVFLPCCGAIWFWDTIFNALGDVAYLVVAPLVILGITGSAYWIVLSFLSAIAWLGCGAFATVDAARDWLWPVIQGKRDLAKRNVRLAQIAFLLCLVNLVWICWNYPPWNRLRLGRDIEPSSALELSGLVMLGMSALVMVICLWWVVPSAFMAMISMIDWTVRRALNQGALDAESLRIADDLRRAEAELHWRQTLETLERGTALPQEEWMDFSESAKNALLDLTGGAPSAPEAWPTPLPPLSPDAVKQLQARVNVTLAALCVILNQSATGDVTPAELPRVKQLFKDLQHDLLALGRQSRIEAAYHELPQPQGHWAERYRQMKKEAALRPSETPPHDRIPSRN